MTCPKCGGKLNEGQALLDIMTGTPDFPGDDYVCTVSPSGKAKLVDCWKCETCGYSVTRGEK